MECSTGGFTGREGNCSGNIDVGILIGERFRAIRISSLVQIVGLRSNTKIESCKGISRPRNLDVWPQSV
jgi:hypothetical protein